MGKKMLKPEKEDRKKGKCILNNFINEVKKDLFRQLFIQNTTGIIGSLVTSIVGAILLLWIVSLLKRSDIS